MWFEKKKKIFLLHLNEFNLKEGFENYKVAKIFDAPSNDKNEWKKKYIYIYTIQYAILILFAALFQINKNKNIYKKLSHHWNTYEKS